jgi:hypothetical protein
LPAGLLTLACFVIQAIDESIEAHVAAALIRRGDSVNRERRPKPKLRGSGAAECLS